MYIFLVVSRCTYTINSRTTNSLPRLTCGVVLDYQSTWRLTPNIHTSNLPTYSITMTADPKRILTFEELSELDIAMQKKAMMMLSEHKDFSILLSALDERRAAKRAIETNRDDERRQVVKAQQRDTTKADPSWAYIVRKQEADEEAERKRVLALSFKERCA